MIGVDKISSLYRPVGPLTWILHHFSEKEWSLIASISTEERSLTVWDTLNKLGVCKFLSMFQIADAVSSLWGEKSQHQMQKIRQDYLKSGGNDEAIIDCDIRDNLDEINQYVDDLILTCSDNIIFDISTFPKRFFFPFLRRIIKNSNAKNIIVTYTRPEQYDTAQPLARDHEPWRSLPGFQEAFEDKQQRKLIVGLGYEPLGLPQILKEGDFTSSLVLLLFPFPGTPSGFLKNWDFVRNLESNVGRPTHKPIRVDAYDVSGIFDIILSHTDDGNQNVFFAPYGTKPMSLAMCLFAIYNPEKTAAYYTQPGSYNPFYSKGVKIINGVPDTRAYCIRINGRDLYKIT